jgi:lysine 2,3-aminomutase
MLSDRRLKDVVEAINAIEHVKILRIHARVPVVDPQRVTDGLIEALRGRIPVFVLLHCNHAKELTAEARAACGRLVDRGIPMLSQSVLLRGINDTAESLGALMRALVESRVKPHHLNHGDLAKGTSHFRVPLDEAQTLLRGIRGVMSGLCQPTYILDIPGGHGKVPVGPVFAVQKKDYWVIESFKQKQHIYYDRIKSV